MAKSIPTPNLAKRRFTQRLRGLVGTWKLEGRFVGGEKPLDENGRVSFRWLVKDQLLVLRSRTSVAPHSVSIIGADDVFKAFTVLYSDVRPVVRRYEMTLTRRRWTLERREPGFHQRFVGRISSNGRRISATWEKSADGRRWMKDFDLVYTKVG